MAKQIDFEVLVNHMRRWLNVSDNLFQSRKTRARRMINAMEREGFTIVRMIDTLDNTPPAQPAPKAGVISPKVMARIYFEERLWQSLLELKKVRKKSYKALGLTDEEILQIPHQYR